MLSKLSALALCISFVAALKLTVPDKVVEKSEIVVKVDFEKDDAKKVDLELHGKSYVVLADSVTLSSEIYVWIPEVIPDDGYYIYATDPKDSKIVYAESNEFEIKKY